MRCNLIIVFLLLSPLIGQVRAPLSPPGDIQPEEPSGLQGLVTDALTGEPVKKATVQLTRRASQPVTPASYSAATEIDGTYKFENLPPGSYVVKVERSGYAEGGYGVTVWNPIGIVVNLRSGHPLSRINVALTPLAVITGKVIDQDGDPVANARVHLLAPIWAHGRSFRYAWNGTMTNDLGEYRIQNVRAGKYVLVFQGIQAARGTELPVHPGKPDIRPVQTYYPDTQSLDKATTLDVKAGQQLSDMNIQVLNAATYHVRGKVTGAIPEGEPFFVTLSSSDGESVLWTPKIPVNPQDRTFDFAGVAPGSYSVYLSPAHGFIRIVARRNVEVSAGDINDVSLQVVPTALHGRISIEGTPQAGKNAINLADLDVLVHGAEPAVAGGFIRTQVQPDGTFLLENLSPGRYNLFMGGLGSQAYESSVQFANQEILGQELDLSNGGGQLNVIVRYGPAEVDGIVQRQQANMADASAPASTRRPPMPNVLIALIPDTVPEDWLDIRVLPTRRDGSFVIPNVPPRNYRAYAIEKLDPAQLQNPNVLRLLQGKGKEISLKENDKQQIRLPLITDDEMHQIYATLGIDPP
jgi:hypothetical protein